MTRKKLLWILVPVVAFIVGRFFSGAVKNVYPTGLTLDFKDELRPLDTTVIIPFVFSDSVIGVAEVRLTSPTAVDSIYFDQGVMSDINYAAYSGGSRFPSNLFSDEKKEIWEPIARGYLESEYLLERSFRASFEDLHKVTAHIMGVRVANFDTIVVHSSLSDSTRVEMLFECYSLRSSQLDKQFVDEIALISDQVLDSTSLRGLKAPFETGKTGLIYFLRDKIRKEFNESSLSTDFLLDLRLVRFPDMVQKPNTLIFTDTYGDVLRWFSPCYKPPMKFVPRDVVT